MGTGTLSVWIASLSSLFLLSSGCGGGGGGVAQPGMPSSEATCTLIGCVSGASYDGDFTLNGTDPNSLELTTCFNTSCTTTPLRFSGKDAWCNGDRSFRCWFSLQAADSVKVRLTVSPPAGINSSSLQDGDHYEARVGAPAQAPLLKLDAIATYTLYYPNGPLCGPACKGTTLQPAP
jgi:hypothetical protein